MTKTVVDQVEYLAYLIAQNVMTMYVCFFKYPDLNSDPYFFAYDSIVSDKMCPEVARYLHTVHYSDQCFYKHQCEHLNCCSDCQAFIT